VETDLVWYVSYGSNLCRARFMTYITGGSLPGNSMVHKGCDNREPPREDVALRLPHSLYFAGASERAWGGTSAGFVTLEKSKPSAFARAYLITQEQFSQVMMQENAHGEWTDAITIDLDRARREGHYPLVSSGFYAEVIFCGERNGHPMLSFTASADRTDFGKPSFAYVKVIASGLREAHGLSQDAIEEYLINTPGISGEWSKDDLRSCIAES
jgi:hypothetical protein